ncbi:hypothetical protein DIURU_002318 [Diutina rugosa]|uniref:Dol-P-Glc:Glc(2)Man(9)GlcNAc(2)-PP-Dol alpha-1,2-glucosyltransferase n=1 Tax=Diutina rugosa TaxID=5481 RepID=A0A642USV1_DIURU|nr:uncharacterized protein DIURU_002318 [Diutina rugosa]KAA8903806.1 hypothetical protein DIURU_002318 [Diutina rugosa]
MLVVPDHRQSGLAFTCYGVLVAAASVIAYYCHKKVDYLFIDEFFHIRQAQTYLSGNFKEWDDKITTPPGLYWLGYGFIKLFNLKDSITNWRAVNLFGGLLVFPIVLWFFPQRQWWIATIVGQPLIYTYYFLFYTDVWSTIFVVAALVASMVPTGPRLLLGGILGFISLWFRQTNILWVAFVLSIALDYHARGKFGWNRLKPFLSGLLSVKVVPFYATFAAFAGFVWQNGGITLGDKSNHQVSFHSAQVLYCLLFICAFTWPAWLSPKLARDYLRAWTRYYGLSAVLQVAIIYGLVKIIEYGTTVHPFLVADNRHYSFYIYRKLFKRAGIWMAPVYHACGWVVVNQLLQARRLSWITTSTFFGAMVLTLVPSPLFEPRYYIVPVVVFRMFINSAPGKWRNLVEFSYLMAIITFVFAVFFGYEFPWDTEYHPQRIIW